MRQLNLIGIFLGWGLASGGSFSAVAAPGASTTPPVMAGGVPVGWKHRRAEFSYFGQTTLYSCPGLEDKIREILVYLGAHEPKVSANGCPQIDAPSQTAFVSMEFDSLAALDAPAVDATAAAVWTPFSLSAHQPRFMGEGDCELVQDMQDVIEKNFDLHHLDYETRCSPHALSSDDFSVHGEALRLQNSNRASK
jgi:hypothetical protein